AEEIAAARREADMSALHVQKRISANLRVHRASAVGFLLCTATAGAQGPAAVTQYQSGIDAQHYAISLVVPDQGNVGQVTTPIYLRRTRAVDSVSFDLEKPMQVRRVNVNGKDVTPTRTDHSVAVALPKWNAMCADHTPVREDRQNSCVDWVMIETSGT